MAETDQQIAVQSNIVKAGTGSSSPVFDAILRNQLTDAEAAKIAQLAAYHITGGGKIVGNNGEDLHPDMLMAAQHQIGVRPAITGVVEQSDGSMVLTRHGEKNEDNPKRLSSASSELIADAEFRELTHSEKHKVGLLEHSNERGIHKP